MDYESIVQIYQDMLKSLESQESISDFSDSVLRLGNYIEENDRAEKKELAELALNYWRLLNWVAKSNADKKSIANSALKRINSYLEKHQIELLDLTEQKYDDGYAADVLGVEAESNVSEEDLIVREMVKPIIIHRGSVIKHGQVILGDKTEINICNADLNMSIDSSVNTEEMHENSWDKSASIEKEQKNESGIKTLVRSVMRLLGRRK